MKKFTTYLCESKNISNQELTSKDIQDYLKDCEKKLTIPVIDTIRLTLEKTPPELSADIMDKGITLTGGGALLRGLEELIEEKTGINTMTAEDPMTAVAIGTGKFIEFLSDGTMD